MVEATDEGEGDDAAVIGWLDATRLGRILREGEVSARPVVIPEVGSETTTKVSLVQNNHVIEKFTADRADHAFGEGVLPRRAWRSENLGEAHALHSSPELVRPMLTPRQAAELLGVHRETIYRLIAHGDLASVRVGSLLRVAARSIQPHVCHAALR